MAYIQIKVPDGSYCRRTDSFSYPVCNYWDNSVMYTGECRIFCQDTIECNHIGVKKLPNCINSTIELDKV